MSLRGRCFASRFTEERGRSNLAYVRTRKYVVISTTKATGFQGFVTARANYERCARLNVVSTSVSKDSGEYFGVDRVWFHDGTQSTEVYLERTVGNDTIFIWYRIGAQTDTLNPGVMVYHTTKSVG